MERFENALKFAKILNENLRISFNEIAMEMLGSQRDNGYEH